MATETISKFKEQISRHVKEREDVFANVSKIYDRVKQYSVEDLSKFEAYMKRLPNYEDKFTRAQDAISNLNFQLPEKERLDLIHPEVAFTELLVSIDALYISLKKTESVNMPPTERDNAQFVAPRVQPSLPVIELPTFHGSLEQWPEFISLYDSLVHNETALLPCKKFQYLKTALKGDALAVISGLQLTPDNYQLAYKALTARYQNKRGIANMYLQKILKFKPGASNSTSILKEFLNVHQTSINAIKALNVADLADFLIFSLALKNVDPFTRRAFENKHTDGTIPTYNQLIDFVTQQLRAVEAYETSTKSSFTPSRPKEKNYSSSNVLLTKSDSNPPPTSASRSPASIRRDFSCPNCKGIHLLFNCPSFSTLSTEQKYDYLKKAQRCFNCLGRHHRDQCRSKGVCRSCHSNRHHTILHPNEPSQINNPSSSRCNPQPQGSATAASFLVNDATPVRQVLLGTVKALVHRSDGSVHPVRAVIDPGSQVSAVSQTVVKTFGLSVHPSRLSISGIGQTNMKPLGIVRCNISSKFSSEPIYLEAVVLPKISNDLPSASVSFEVAQRFQHLSLADEDFCSPSAVDMLLGADVYPYVIKPDHPIHTPGYPSAINTYFGWTIVGPVDQRVELLSREVLLSTAQLSDEIRKFWELEEVAPLELSNPLDDLADTHFKETHYRDQKGRYVVSLPFTPQATPLATNSARALQSFRRLESRLKRIPENHAAYNDFMKEYLNLEHMSPTSTHATYVIPHHVITKASSATTKTRVVFNASDPDASGVSLNDRLLRGPKLQKDISEILLNFRLHPIALRADIEKMYRQILIKPEDRHYQRVFWRPSDTQEICEFELNTVTYGVTPSAYLAIRVLHQLVEDEGDPFPLASNVIVRDMYVDDVITGVKDIPSAIALRDQLQELLRKGGFELRKWTSNAPEVLEDLPPDYIDSKLEFSDSTHPLKILGLSWIPKTDSFTFRVAPFTQEVTKRSILSYIAQIFDPIGFLAPVVFAMKVILQRLWLCKIDWDEVVPPVIASEWVKLTHAITSLASLHIPRCVCPVPPCALMLAGFCDSSQMGYAAAVYLSFRFVNNPSSSFLWKAKTKVAPLKVLTIPRLELCAAVLLSQLVKSVCSLSFPIPLASIRLFSDSENVLSWLSTPPHMLKPFVANRVVTIQDNVPHAIWSHIDTSLNPADIPSRGLHPTQFLRSEIQRAWFNGPEFLTEDESNWSPPFRISNLADLNELRQQHVSLLVEPVTNQMIKKIETFSSFNRLIRVFSWVNRVAYNTKRNLLPNFSKKSGPLYPDELDIATATLVRVTQRYYFDKEIQAIESHRTISNRLRSLNPFVDEQGLLRVGGRLSNASLPFESKHPLLLPKESHLSRLLCIHYHVTSLHSGPNTTQALIRSKYWILSLRGLLRKCIHSCLTCHKFRASSFRPRMADLPHFRVTVSRPFSCVGVDFAGPFAVRSNKSRKPLVTKGYLSLFICTTTKAVHLEFVSELSTPAFLSALNRFVARRGLPREIHSDHGRNFIGAARHIAEVSEFLKVHNEDICDQLSAREIRWVFIPPYSPHFGGLWEAGVKSAKALLIRMIGLSCSTFEEYTTLFARIEAVLNSRPLGPLSEDPAEASNYLTPGHFLVGGHLLSPPERDLTPIQCLRTRWERHSQILQTFWRRWSKEYLNTLIQRKKWASFSESPKIGDIVFIKGAQSHPLSWPLGRIERLLPGRDNVARVASVRTASGVYTRAVNGLVPLPAQA